MENYDIIENQQTELINFITVKDTMTRRATDLIASEYIMKPTFPLELPKFFPLTFNNYGHYYLFDHERFLTIIYQTTEKYKKISTGFKPIQWHFWAAFVVTLVTLTIYLTQVREASTIEFLACFLPGVLVLILVQPQTAKKMDKALAAYKAEVLRRLLEGTWMPDEEVGIPESLQALLPLIGHANCIEGKCPILVMFEDENPFPGFGKMLLDKQFVCSPKKIEQTVHLKEDDFFFEVTMNLRERLMHCQIANIGFGKIVVLSAESITIDSPWLQESKIPFLLKDLEDVEMLAKDERHASSRVHFLIEILFPKYDTSACFFVRTYKAGAAVGFHISITSVGPPHTTEKDVKAKLRRHAMEESSDKTAFDEGLNTDTSRQAREIFRIRSQAKFMEKFHIPILKSSLDGIDVLEEKKGDKKIDYQEKCKKIIENETSWPGSYYYFPRNIRDRHSKNIGGDFFGYPELTGAITSAYNEVVDCILNIVAAKGFDVSPYRDKDGKLTINADRIESVLVGEVVNIKSKDPEKKTGEAQASTEIGKQN